uniref:hypothetical protein n=1 Tax=Dubosiella newyorkensis TaxID=1862672 RepID=UPI0023F1B54C
ILYFNFHQAATRCFISRLLSTWKDPTFDKALEEPIAIVYKIQNFEKFLFLSFTINSIIKEIKKGKDTIKKKL